MQGGDALQCLDPCHPAARFPDRGYGHAASTRPLPLQTARYETRLETPTFGRAAPSRLRSPPPRARCLLGSVVHAARRRAAADYASRQAARPRRGGGGRAAVAERTNGRGRCSLVSAGAGGPPPGPLAVREFRTGRKERRPGLGAEEVFEAGVWCWGVVFFFRRRVWGHRFVSPSARRAFAAPLAFCGRVFPLPSLRRLVVFPGPARALFLPLICYQTIGKAFPVLSPIPVHGTEGISLGRQERGEWGWMGKSSLSVTSGVCCTPFAPPSWAVGSKAAFWLPSFFFSARAT